MDYSICSNKYGPKYEKNNSTLKKASKPASLQASKQESKQNTCKYNECDYISYKGQRA